jgi:2-keto-4-pentenoate hydratase
MEINGVPVGEGSGALVMGHPFEALLWLARSRHARGLGLEKGHVILLGSLVETRWVNAGDTVTIQVDQLGDVMLKIQ